MLACSYFYLFDANTLEYMTCLGEVISEAYVLEYGTDCLEMHVGAVYPGERVLVIDDIVATGGTLSAAIRLLGKVMWFSYNLILITLSLPISTDFQFSALLTSNTILFFINSERVGAEVVECACVVGIPELKVFFISMILSWFLLQYYISNKHDLLH